MFGKGFTEETDGDVRELRYMQRYSNLTVVVSEVERREIREHLPNVPVVFSRSCWTRQSWMFR